MTRSVRILREADIRDVLDMASCIEACERAFIAYSNGGAELPGVIHLDVPQSEGQIHVKAGYLHGDSRYAVKMSSGFYGGASPALDGMVVVFDARNGSTEPFYLYDPYDTNPKFSYDPTGVATVGRYIVRFNGDWQQSSGPGRSDVQIELLELG